MGAVAGGTGRGPRTGRRMAERRPTGTAAGFWRCPARGGPTPAASYVGLCLGCGAVRPRDAAPVPASFAGPGATLPPDARVLIAPPRGRYLRLASWAYAAVVLMLVALIHWLDDAWWGVV